MVPAPELSRVRNFGIAAHIDAGKTTVSERMLFYSGVEHRMGEVHEGAAVMDWMEEERKRGITITSAATTLPWGEHTLNLIDTPGHVDFTVEVERCLRVLDGAVLVVNGVNGVQAQSETVHRQMVANEVPFVAFVNQCDRAGADPLRCVQDLKDRLAVPAIPVQLPIGAEKEFRGVVDLIERRALLFKEDDQGAEPEVVDVPEELADEVGVLRAELLDALADEDEEILTAVLDDADVPPEQLREALRRRVLARSLVPVLCGAALRNVGVQPLLDAVVHYLHSHLDVPPVRGKDPKTGEELERRADPDEPFCALAFKLQADVHEDLTYVRVYSGTMEPGQKLWNPRTKRMERVSRVLRMHADHRSPVERAGPGDIVALTGCKQTATGDTLCDRAGNVLLESDDFPEPVITMGVEPASTADRDKLRAALDRLVFEDPTFRVREDEETGQWLMEGMGELHLEVVRHRLESEFKVGARIGQPRVAYREAVRTPGRGAGKVDRQVGGKDVYGEVEVVLEAAGEPGPPRVDWEPGVEVPEAMQPTVTEALELSALSGPRFGFPLVGAVIRVVGGGSSPSKDAEMGFAQAAGQALREAMAAAEVDLLEPVMRFEVQTPSEFASGIIADLNSRSAELAEVGADAEQRTLTGTVPLFQMFGYSTGLRSLSQGRAGFSLEPAGFRVVPEAELEARGLVWS